MKVSITIWFFCLLAGTATSRQHTTASRGILSEQLKTAALNLSCLHETDNYLAEFTGDSLLYLGKQAQEAAEAINDPAAKAHANLMLSTVHIRVKDFSRALSLLREALAIFEAAGYRPGQGAALHYMAFIYEKRGDLQRGLTLYLQSLHQYDAQHQPVESMYTLRSIGNLYAQTDQPPKALSNYQKALQIAQDINRPDLLQRAHYLLGSIHLKRGDPEIALNHLNTALHYGEGNGDRKLVAAIWHLLGDAHLQNGATDSAVYYFQTAFDLAGKEHQPEILQHVCNQLFVLFENRQDHERALFYHKIYKSAADSLAKKNHLEQAELAKKENSYKMELVHYEHLLEQEKANHRLALGGLGIALLLLFIIGRYYYRERAGLQLLEKKHHEVLLTRNQLIVKEKLAFLGQMAAGIAHEIKNPLNFVTNFAEGSLELTEELVEELENRHLLQENDWGDNLREIVNELNENAVIINRNGRRANRIVNSIMQHANGEEGELQEVDLPMLLDENLKLAYHGYRVVNPSFFMTIQKNYDPSIQTLALMPQDLERVLLNIITNACQALNQKLKKQPDNFTPTLEVTTSLREASLRISIRDNGPGIPEETKAKIFLPFYTTKTSETRNIGLGLSICHDLIVTKHRGTLEVRSQPGQFTDFEICLPIQKKAG